MEVKDSKYDPILSVADAERELVDWNRNEKEMEDYPTFIVLSIQENPDIYGTSYEYHNLSSEFARKDLYKYAEKVASIGAKKYKYNVDLLADIVKFGSQSQDWDNCKIAYERLLEIDYSKWNWRTFTFVIDYLMDEMEIEGEGKEQEFCDVIHKHIEEYKRLKDERAWVAEAELYIRHGQRIKAITTLKDGINTIRVTPQCCLKIVDLLLAEGEYEEVIKYSAVGVRGTAQDQPSASNGYLLYASALAKDALINEEEIENGGKDKEKGFHNLDAVKDALLDYEIAKQLLNGRYVYIQNINQRMLILKSKSGIRFDNEVDNQEKVALNLLDELIKHTSDINDEVEDA